MRDAWWQWWVATACYHLESNVSRPGVDVGGLIACSMKVSGSQHTVGWSNFDPLDPKMGVFLKSTEATTCGHLLK